MGATITDARGIGTIENDDATPQTFTLTVALAGDGAGQVTGPGIACPGDCTQDFAVGTEVTLEAVADLDSTFMGWSGDCTGTEDCTVTMSDDRAVTATFDPSTPNHRRTPSTTT